MARGHLCKLSGLSTNKHRPDRDGLALNTTEAISFKRRRRMANMAELGDMAYLLVYASQIGGSALIRSRAGDGESTEKGLGMPNKKQPNSHCSRPPASRNAAGRLRKMIVPVLITGLQIT